MVRGVCRQFLRHSHDADDAFQATFLVLVRKARSIRVRKSLAPWLYGVAYRTALRARAAASQYREERVDEVEAIGAPADDSFQLDLRPLLHEELARLPDKYRVPIVLCHLEGKTHEQAADLLHWPIGTVSGRLSRGRELLKSRLERRGLGAPSAILCASSLYSGQSLPSSLVEATLTTATRFAASQSVCLSVLSLTHGVLRAMFVNKLRTVSLVILLVGAMTGGVGVWAHWLPIEAGQPIQDEKSTPPTALKDFVQVAQDSNPGASKNNPPGTPLGDLIPDGQQVFTIASRGVIALAYTGKAKVGTIAAYSPDTGEWYSYELANPVQSISPTVGTDCAVPSRERLLCLQAPAGKWDLLRLPADQKAMGTISEKFIEVRQGNRLYVFGVKPGKWSKGVAITTEFPPRRSGLVRSRSSGQTRHVACVNSAPPF